MKEVMIILRPKMYFPTKDALDQAGFHSMTIREIIGRGKCPVHYDYDEGAPVKHRLVAKRMIDMYVRDEDLLLFHKRPFAGRQSACSVFCC